MQGGGHGPPCPGIQRKNNEAGKFKAGAEHPADRVINALERRRLFLGRKYFKVVRFVLLRIKISRIFFLRCRGAIG